MAVLGSEHVAKVIEWTGHGLSSGDIAKKLEAEYGIKVHASAIRQRIQRVRNERTDMTQAAAAVKLGEHVTSDLDALKEAADMAGDIARRTYAMGIEHAPAGTVHADSAQLCLKALKEWNGILSTRLKAAGLGGEGKGLASHDELPKESEARAKLFRALAEREESKR